MQLPPFDFWNISLWLGISAIILLITEQLISSYDGPSTVLVNRKRLRYASLTLDLLFLATVAIRIYGIIATPS